MSFVEENGLHIPFVLSREFRQEFFGKATGKTVDLGLLRGSPADEKELNSRATKLASLKSIETLARLNNCLARSGIEKIVNSSLQHGILDSALRSLEKEGVSSSYSPEGNDVSIIPESILATIALIMNQSEDLKSTGIEIDDLMTLIYATNDLLLNPKSPYSISDQRREFFAYILRHGLTYSPLAHPLGSIQRKLNRFLAIWDILNPQMDNDLKKDIDRFIESEFGVDLESFKAMIFPLSSIWINSTDADIKVRLNIEDIQNPSIRTMVGRVMAHLSLDIKGFREKINGIGVEDLQYMKSSSLLRLFSEFPFLRVDDGKFLLLSPQCLTRRFELALTSSYLNNKPTQENPRRLLTVLGEVFETYVGQVLRRVLVEGDLSNYQSHPNFEGEELCDGVITGQNRQVYILEIKNKMPRLDSLGGSDDDVTRFLDWIDLLFLNPRISGGSKNAEPGALTQLNEAIDKVLNKNALGFVPSRVTPLVICSAPFGFGYPEVEVVLNKSEELGYFSDQRITDPLILSIDDLERLTTVKSDRGGELFISLLSEKCLGSNLGHPWMLLAKNRDLEFDANKWEEASMDRLMSMSLEMFENEQETES